MSKDSIALIHFNNLINDLITVIGDDTNDGVSMSMFNQFMEDFINIINDNPNVSDQFGKQFKAFVNHLNTEVDSIDKQRRALSQLVLFNGKYMSNNQ
ncbi:hypothetical protein [Acetilactobacillus jinshanensis]|uniref:Uncharacterized protein n=1 Tax=Acetilactobacillus jinshanensis TaxID=1720083 RepID=A0A4P6ZM69_9LACO|nr:hypothetical protein [Acetilactobacillus jinshanensis]QBP18946.1 hypothetical protein ELX58_07610 [Acetilactobacillus jinshanensis]URL60504.1 hypothetical protein HGK75_00185 [uncultured bacterium]